MSVKLTKIVSGSVASSFRTNRLVFDNMKTSFDLYSTKQGTHKIRTLFVNDTKRFVRGVAFGERGRVIVCGSHHGKAYIFEENANKPIQYLRHAGSEGMVQSVAVGRPKLCFLYPDCFLADCMAQKYVLDCYGPSN